MAKLDKHVRGNDVINVGKMRDGQMGVIVNWTDSDAVGEVVQRYGGYLVVLGERFQNSYDVFFTVDRTNQEPNCLVQIFKPGDKITLEIE